MLYVRLCRIVFLCVSAFHCIYIVPDILATTSPLSNNKLIFNKHLVFSIIYKKFLQEFTSSCRLLLRLQRWPTQIALDEDCS